MPMINKTIAAVVVGLFLLVGAPVPLSLANDAPATDTQLTLTLDQATERALHYSKTLKSASIDVYVAEDNSENTSWNPTWDTTYVEDTETKYSNMVTAENQYESAVLKKGMQEDSVIAQTRSSYYDLLQAIDKVEVQKSSMAAGEKSWKISQIYFDVGMLSQIAYDQAQVQYNQSKNNLISAESDLVNKYISFNQLVGLNIEDRPILTDTPKLEKLDVSNPAAQIALIISDSPSLEIAYNGVQLKQDIVDRTGMTETADLQVDQANLSVTQTKEALIKGLYNIYYSIKNLEDTYPVAQSNVAVADNNLRIAKLKYEIGMGTQYDVMTAENSLEQAQNTLLTLICNHETLKESFFKPWASS